MITYLPDGRQVTVTEKPGPVFRAVLAADPDGTFGYGTTADGAVGKLLDLEAQKACHRAVRRRYRLTDDTAEVLLALEEAGYIDGNRRDSRDAYLDTAVHHTDGNPYNNDPANLVRIDARENTRGRQQ